MGRHCRERWESYLSHLVRKSNWTNEEDINLFEAVLKFGNNWNVLSKILNREASTIKNRYQIYIKSPKNYPHLILSYNSCISDSEKTKIKEVLINLKNKKNELKMPNPSVIQEESKEYVIKIEENDKVNKIENKETIEKLKKFKMLLNIQKRLHYSQMLLKASKLLEIQKDYVMKESKLNLIATFIEGKTIFEQK